MCCKDWIPCPCISPMTRLHSKNIIVLQSSKVCIFPTGMMHESYKNRSDCDFKDSEGCSQKVYKRYQMACEWNIWCSGINKVSMTLVDYLYRLLFRGKKVESRRCWFSPVMALKQTMGVSRPAPQQTHPILRPPTAAGKGILLDFVLR